MRILIAEDDEPLARFVRQGLEAERYTVDVVTDGEQARTTAMDSEYDVVILDLNLPKMDGVTVLRHLRAKKPTVPVLILTQRIRVEDRVQCLDSGADDYLGKPFSFSELSARVRALVRRSHLPSESVLAIADLKLDRVQRLAERAGKRIDLTTKEFSLLEYLMRNGGRRVTRSMIIEHVWNLTFDTTTNVVDVYINYSSAQVDKRKMGKLSSAIQEAFQQFGVGPSGKADVLINSIPLDPAHAIEQANRASEKPTAALPAVAVAIPNEPSLNTLQDELKLALQDELSRKTVALHRESEGLVITLREFGFFDSASVALRPEAMPALDRIASVLAVRTYRLRVEGHTDNIPIHTKQINSNWELSTTRSTEIVRLLIQHYRFSPDRLSAAGYAEYHPIASNETSEGRAQNRRIDIVVLAQRAAP